ncbi:hypothetical protein [Ponticaulis koreensis]|uniref:hypothetical protein n=1 Tax=Ponticaulis koreensis TaxID=1123045 RepID=UPI0012DC8124|nr:hypothetical protein [Ponticaulis koreensis]
MADRIDSIKRWFEWAFDLWRQLRPPRIQRYAGYVILFGLMLLVVNFNDLLFEYFLQPVGFDRQGNVAWIVAVMLVAMGLLTLLGDRLIENRPAGTYLQDKELFREAREVLPWDRLNSILNNLNHRWIWSEDRDRVSKMLRLLEDEANRFVNPRVQKSFDDFAADLAQLSDHMNKNFFVPRDHIKVTQYLMLPDIDSEVTGVLPPRYTEAASTLDSLVERVESSYKKFVATGRDVGLVSKQNAASHE